MKARFAILSVAALGILGIGSGLSPAATSSPDATATVVAAGGLHTCAITSVGGLKCWGRNNTGQVGDGTTTNRLTPVDVSGLSSGVTTVAAGFLHACALTSAGGVKCWGLNSDGELGDGKACGLTCKTPVNVTGLSSGVQSIATGEIHSCAVTTAGGAKCWGVDDAGQLGDEDVCGPSCSTPVDVSGLSTGVNAMTAGRSHTCALTNGGGVKCWGWNQFGQLGDGTTTDHHTPVNVFGLTSGVTAIAAGLYHTCALTSAGGVKCWGNNENGELGDGTTTNRSTPTDVLGMTTGVQTISARGFTTCALLSGGGVKCWGYNGFGQLGDGTTDDSSTPVEVSGLPNDVQAIAAGSRHTCALANGGVRCWGSNSDGQLGNGTTDAQLSPLQVGGLSGVQAISAGSDHTCALAGGAKCWGANHYGQLGDGTTHYRDTATGVSGLSSGVQATAGSLFGCALTTAGAAKCWGTNSYGQLGDGTTTEHHTPVDVAGVSSGLTAIAAGGDHACALTNTGGVKCWGDNTYGQLGDGRNCGFSCSTPVDVSGLSGVIAITVGGSHTCALTNGGGVKCWGYNYYGQLGDGTTTNRTTPVDISGLSSGASAVAAGGSHTCALTDAGRVQCWGSNHEGQLGDGTTTDRHTPVNALIGPGSAAAITTGGAHTCTLRSAGGVKCWGQNDVGQLGDGQTCGNVACSTPVDVTGLPSGVQAIAAGGLHTCALTGAANVVCWGFHPLGFSPVAVVGFGPPKNLTVSKAGNGSGTVTSTPSGIDCGSTCVHDFADGTDVTLTATAQAGSSFAGWSGDCTGTGTCTVTMSANHSTTATFALVPKTLAITKVGSGSGTITSDPSGIDCGSTCSTDFAHGTEVTLAASPQAGSFFAGWTGDCSGTGTCTLTMSANHLATATFTLVPKTLVVSKVGGGLGTIASNPAGIACGSACTHDFDHGTSVTLTTIASAGSSFTGWSGDCSGTGTCTITMSANRSVVASFETDKTLTVNKTGGAGSVTSSPGGIDCGATCSHAYAHGMSVTLTVTASSGTTFSGWSGDCSGTGTCVLTMSADHSATAAFDANPPPPPPPPPERCVVPRLRGRRLAAAKSAIRRANCAIGKISRTYSAKVDEGRVVWQRPSPGKDLAEGGKVNLVVSRGKRH